MTSEDAERIRKRLAAVSEGLRAFAELMARSPGGGHEGAKDQAAAALALSNAQFVESLHRDLEERWRAETQAKHFVALVQHSSDFIAMAELGGRVLFINDAGRRLLGLDLDLDLSQLRLTDFHTDEGMKRAAVIQAQGHWQGEGHLRHSKTGELIETSINSFLLKSPGGEPFGYATVQRDIRERKKLEAHLRHAQRMEAVGRLAGGIAHDFNNVLSVVLGCSALLLDDPSLDAATRSALDDIQTAAQGGARLTRQLLAFSRQQVLEPRVVDLNDVLSGIEKMTRRLLGRAIELRVLACENLGKVKIDVGQIEQVVLNLVLNARDAMPRGGVLTIATSNESTERGEPGGVKLVVSDTGTGMDEGTRQHLFEPFFTTKSKGTGLGLATVFGIVEQSGGSISVSSEMGRGTTFSILLPRCDVAAPAADGRGINGETAVG